MGKPSVQLFCILNLTVIVCCVAENEKSNQNFCSNGKNARYCENSIHTNDKNVERQVEFSGIHEDLGHESSNKSRKNSSKCLDDIMYILQNKRSLWAMKLFDSYGKPESGILQGNTRWFGSYNECLNITSTNPNETFGNFKGKYCIASLSFNVAYMDTPLNISSAVCVPDSCSPEDLQEHLFKLLTIPGILPNLNGKETISQIFSLKCLPRERHLDNAAIAVIVMLSLIFTLNLAGSLITAFKYFKERFQGYKYAPVTESVVSEQVGDQNYIIKEEKNDRSPLQENLVKNTTGGQTNKLTSFLNCFCVFTNGSKILNTNTSEEDLLCIHGIRSISMCWIIYVHVLYYQTGQIKNLLVLHEHVDTFLFHILNQGPFCVDSFFLLSGFLVAYQVMKDLDKSGGRKSWPYFYFHRYIRLTPSYMIILAFYTSLFLYLGSGPFWPEESTMQTCKDSWWQNLLYIHNFRSMENQCIAWTWYLSNDMQFFLISPLFLITLWRTPKIGYSFITISILACCLLNFFITYHFELMPGMPTFADQDTPHKKTLDYLNKLYTKPYTRINPYLIGMLTAYLLYKRKKNNSSRHSWLFLFIGWMVSICFCFACIFLIYELNLQVMGSSLYNAFCRTVYSVCLGWVIYACLVGQGGFVNGILSYKFFIPLSKLTYIVYLIHPIIMEGYYFSMKESSQANGLTTLYLYVGLLTSSYALSLPVTLMLQSPVPELEKWTKKSFIKLWKNH